MGKTQQGNDTAQRIFLTGYMGAGKSTVGKLLADKLGYGFYDTDFLVKRGYGNKSISAIFDEFGEAAFRNAEKQVLTTLCERARLVASTGGGTLARQEAMDMARAHGWVVYLSAPVDALYERVVFSPKDRPILEQPDTEAVFKQTFATRQAIYEQAHCQVNVHDREPDAVVRDILQEIPDAFKET